MPTDLQEIKFEIEGKRIVDFYLSFERVLNRLDTAITGAQNADADADDSAWRGILEDEGYKAVEELTALKRDLEKSSNVLEYIKAKKEEYAIVN